MPAENAAAPGGAPVTLYVLHALGASARSFDRIAERLDGRVRVEGIDLPGFGSLAAAGDSSIEPTVAHVVDHLARHARGRWMLGGHSMGGKIAALVASGVLRGDAPLVGLAGMVLMAPSPPRPEPMDEERRERMLSWVADGPLSEQDAEEFLAQNTAEPLDPAAHAEALADLQRTSPDAWRAWLETGSRVDASAEVGTLNLPVLVLAGTDDDDLGAAAQPGLLASVYPRARFAALDDTGHLIPLERPTEAAESIARFVADEVLLGPVVPAEWAALIAGDRVDARVRGILNRRAVPDDRGYAPAVLDVAQLTLLREIADLVVPQDDAAIDLAARVDAQLAREEGDGWRNADLPPDPEAYRAGLDTLAGTWPTDPADREAVLRQAIEGTTDAEGPLDAALLKVWLEDARNDLLRQWLAHPASMARIGYDGFATGGSPIRGFVELRLGRREDWEPAGVGGTVATGDAA
ncbi:MULTISPECIES: alpha/beta hydrolase [Microbacterium]|uniref:alpha/beta hydrolase n=1 Tax=Microbacterium TaxID=33882 RepID=UPI0027896E90|nr:MULTISPECIES: alpha/beta hydrolase [Microbacterium]MDQ1085181.1 pimeloyl-ACP methyl ester carboxylesterase [Microbacterium sp. SORGH_AS_0344]MDQ1169513.1 pimeloyl-ACP methyl ester carboxylesterase [Microbacterium proteolyticum]